MVTKNCSIGCRKIRRPYMWIIRTNGLLK
uniref:Uncharacterized protein n=1 Tax=Anguilla anguilla TaxID=7936 RepID=A0A0E9T5A8_ANGAN